VDSFKKLALLQEQAGKQDNNTRGVWVCNEDTILKKWVQASTRAQKMAKCTTNILERKKETLEKLQEQEYCAGGANR